MTTDASINDATNKTAKAKQPTSTASDYNDEQLVAHNKDERARTKDVTDTHGTEFADLELKRGLKPSPVQEGVIPKALAGQDILVRAKNGTDKIGAYMIPVLQLTEVNDSAAGGTPQALILVPTRKLALQTSRICEDMGKHLKVKVLAVTGGAGKQGEIMRLQEPVDVLVATPGRLLDFINRGLVKLNKCKIIVLDEADKLLSQNMSVMSVQIIEAQKAQTDKATGRVQLMLLSATLPTSVGELTQRYLADPAVVNLMQELTLTGITQNHAFVEERRMLDQSHRNMVFQNFCMACLLLLLLVTVIFASNTDPNVFIGNGIAAGTLMPYGIMYAPTINVQSGSAQTPPPPIWSTAFGNMLAMATGMWVPTQMPMPTPTTMQTTQSPNVPPECLALLRCAERLCIPRTCCSFMC